MFHYRSVMLALKLKKCKNKNNSNFYDLEKSVLEFILKCKFMLTFHKISTYIKGFRLLSVWTIKYYSPVVSLVTSYNWKNSKNS